MTASRAATGRTFLDAALAGVRVRVRSALLALRVAATGRLAPIPPIDVVGVAPRPGGCLVAGAGAEVAPLVGVAGPPGRGLLGGGGPVVEAEAAQLDGWERA